MGLAAGDETRTPDLGSALSPHSGGPATSMCLVAADVNLDPLEVGLVSPL